MVRNNHEINVTDTVPFLDVSYLVQNGIMCVPPCKRSHRNSTVVHSWSAMVIRDSSPPPTRTDPIRTLGVDSLLFYHGYENRRVHSLPVRINDR